MALTAEEKDRRRLATNARNRAYHTRHKERRAAEESGLKEIDSRLGPDIDAALAAEKSLRAERDAALNDVDRRIFELQCTKKALQADFSDRYEALRKKTHALMSISNDQKRLLDRDLDARFPDLVGAALWSAACWKPIREMEGQ